MPFWTKSLAENPPASFSGDARTQLWHAYASGEQRLGGERGHNARLITAIAYFRRVLEEWTGERVPLDWAKALDCSGEALVARLTRYSAERLALRAGTPVFAIVKSVSFDRESLGAAWRDLRAADTGASRE
jgi:hypothetical protein